MKEIKNLEKKKKFKSKYKSRNCFFNKSNKSTENEGGVKNIRNKDRDIINMDEVEIVKVIVGEPN